jgi:transcriptional regulator with XRE-family HTH domain
MATSRLDGDFIPMTSDQCRMARAAIKWKVRDLADKASVGVNTVWRFEGGATANDSTIRVMQLALEAAGVVFIPENGGGAGVRLRERAKDARE